MQRYSKSRRSTNGKESNQFNSCCQRRSVHCYNEIYKEHIHLANTTIFSAIIHNAGDNARITTIFGKNGWVNKKAHTYQKSCHYPAITRPEIGSGIQRLARAPTSEVLLIC